MKRTLSNLTVIALLAWNSLSASLSAAEAPKKMALPKPTLESADIRGLQRGFTNQVKLTGKELDALTAVKAYTAGVNVTLLAEPKATKTAAWLSIAVPMETKRGVLEISASNVTGESAKLKLFVDSLPQTKETTNTVQVLAALPVAAWGELTPQGDKDTYEFTAKAGQKLVLELNTKSLGSGIASPRMKLLDSRGITIASAQPLTASEDTFLIFPVVQSGTYRVEIDDATLGMAKDQFYRLSVGELPFVTQVYPFTIGLGTATTVQLQGVNLGQHSSASVTAKQEGEINLELPDDIRSRLPLRVLAENWPTILESEPNNSPGEAQPIQLPIAINGRLQTVGKGQPADVDIYRFEAKAGQQLVLETLAAKRGSLADTKLEVFYSDGRRVERVLLQATRDSYNKSVRTVDPNMVEVRTEHWEEMELNQYLYMAGEVGKLYRWPFGPDSGFQLYFRNEKRVTYFDTTAASHALYEPFYIVEPHPPGTKLVANGLPTFTLYYENDDESMRDAGSDSRILFKAPLTSSYLVRVSDSRSLNSELHAYRLAIRPAKPDFRVRVEGVNPSVPPGNGRAFTVEVDRLDGFEGEVKVETAGLPPGFFATSPVVVQAGHFSAEGTLYALPDAKAPMGVNATNSQITASALINGKTVTHEVNNFGTIKLGEAPKFTLTLIPTNSNFVTIGSQVIPEIVISPGESMSAMIKVQRNGETNIISLDMDNLPHGVLVDNVGLNGVQVRAGEDEREIFLTAFKWVPETDRLCQIVVKSARATAGSQGLQTSFPVMLKVRHKKPPVTASAR
jgi:hypothetical protein